MLGPGCRGISHPWEYRELRRFLVTDTHPCESAWIARSSTHRVSPPSRLRTSMTTEAYGPDDSRMRPRASEVRN